MLMLFPDWLRCFGKYDFAYAVKKWQCQKKPFLFISCCITQIKTKRSFVKVDRNQLAPIFTKFEN